MKQYIYFSASVIILALMKLIEVIELASGLTPILFGWAPPHLIKFFYKQTSVHAHS